MPPKVFQPAQDPFDDWEQVSLGRLMTGYRSIQRLS